MRDQIFKIVSFFILLTTSHVFASNPISQGVYENSEARNPISQAYMGQGSSHNPVSTDQAIKPVKTYEIGEYAQGGIVFELNDDKTKGLVCSIIYMPTSGITPLQWGSVFSAVPNADDDDDGKVNTDAILEYQTQNPSYSYQAATACASYAGGGYTDWYLPAKNQLFSIYFNRIAIQGSLQALINAGLTADLLDTSQIHWSSTQNLVGSSAYTTNFNDGITINLNLLNSYLVRAVRSF